MNEKDRLVLQKAISALEAAVADVESLRDAEQEKFDNMSEGLQASENGQRLSNNVDEMTSFLDEIGDVVTHLENVE